MRSLRRVIGAAAVPLLVVAGGATFTGIASALPDTGSVVAPAGAMTGDRRSAQATQSGEAAQSERIEVAERDGINGEDRTDSGSASETDDDGLRTLFGPNQG